MSKTRRREELLAAARTVFAHRGYQAKVEEIAAEAKVAKGTVYLYFPDKRSIFVELIDALFGRLAEAILRVDTGGDVAEQVKHNIRAILSVLVDDPDTMRMLFSHASGVDPAFGEKIDSFYDGLKMLLTESLKEGQELGIVAEGDARLYATFTLGGLKEILWEVARRPEVPRQREEIVDAVYALLQRGYLRVPPRPR
ncbi:MAG: TetR/AcrR family transcriptional regulator [Myxococcales bacterium]|nr:TetR/AcrR family transcriptional regulator [Myxococcales bacterium]